MIRINSIFQSIHPSWNPFFDREKEEEYFKNLEQFLSKELSSEHTILPPKELILNAFKLTSLDKIKVVIIGQDPYHKQGQGMGLSFSVPESCPIPPSLRRIFKELKDDLKFESPSHGNLSVWAEQGVLLLNAMLTVREGNAGSHKKSGWETFTDHCIQEISDKKKQGCFYFMG